MSTPNSSTGRAADFFATTHWTAVLAARSPADPRASAALEELCRTYWFPLYAYIRRRGHTREDAEDLTQAFFERFLQKNYLADVQAERGRFRAFLLAALKHFLANEWDKTQRQKRGGTVPHLSLDWASADSQFQLAAENALSPDQAYDREWAMSLLQSVLARLQAEWGTENREDLFEQLKPFLTTPKGEISYSELSTQIGMNETALRVTVHRLRKRYRELLRTEIAHTLVDPANMESELQALFGAFSSKSF